MVFQLASFLGSPLIRRGKVMVPKFAKSVNDDF